MKALVVEKRNNQIKENRPVEPVNELIMKLSKNVNHLTDSMQKNTLIIHEKSPLKRAFFIAKMRKENENWRNKKQ